MSDQNQAASDPFKDTEKPAEGDLRKAEPSAPLTQTSGQALGQVNNAEPVNASPKENIAGKDGTPGGSTLAELLTYYPLMRFFCWLARRQYDGAENVQNYVQHMRSQHKSFYRLCVTIDAIIIVVVTALLLLAAAAALYKTIWLGVGGAPPS